MLICPHCEKTLGEEHDARGCRRKMTRRFFLPLLGGIIAGPIVDKRTTGTLFDPHGHVHAQYNSIDWASLRAKAEFIVSMIG